MGQGSGRRKYSPQGWANKTQGRELRKVPAHLASQAGDLPARLQPKPFLVVFFLCCKSLFSAVVVLALCWVLGMQWLSAAGPEAACTGQDLGLWGMQSQHAPQSKAFGRSTFQKQSNALVLPTVTEEPNASGLDGHTIPEPGAPIQAPKLPQQALGPLCPHFPGAATSSCSLLSGQG